MEAKVSFVIMRGMHNFALPGQNNNIKYSLLLWKQKFAL